MKDEIKEILDRLERIDHKEYIAFDFADNATFDEMARCFEERKKMAKYITNLQEELEIMIKDDERSQETIIKLSKENERLKHNLEQMYNDTKDTYNEICAEQIDYKQRNEKAIGYMQDNNLSNFDKDLYYILIGGDEE